MAFGFSEPAGSPLHWSYVAPDVFDNDDWDEDEPDDDDWDDDEDVDEEQREWDDAVEYVMAMMN